MSSAVVIPARKTRRPPGGARRDRVGGEHVSFGRKQPGEEAFEIEVVREATEHRHRQVGVGVDESRHDDRPRGVDGARSVGRAGEGPTCVIVPATTSTVAPWCTVPDASIVTTVVSLIVRSAGIT